MEYLSVLDKEYVISKDTMSGELLTDLNMDCIIGKISQLWGSNVKPFYGYFPQDEAAIVYRQQVYCDIEKYDLYEGLMEFYTTYAQSRAISSEKERTRQMVRCEVIFANEVALYCIALKQLNELFKDCDFVSEGLTKFSRVLGDYVSSKEFTTLFEASDFVRSRLAESKFTLTYENKKIVYSEEISDRDYLNELSSIGKLDPISMTSPFADSYDLEGIEQEVIRLYMKKNPEVFKAAADLYKKQTEYSMPWAELFFDEISFYLSFYRFEREMKAHGADFSIPTSMPDKDINAAGLYDLALYVASLDRPGYKVISNDFHYSEGELFFVLTGPNQGGKTTFARSLGQLAFLYKMGLKVPAKASNVHYFEQILTHFSVEESVETGRGKLMEELIRLSPMMKDAKGNSFIIINELFTTAANYDACIMGKKVLAHFISKNCHGIYVTHLTELLEVDASAVGLSARLDENGRQTYKIERAIMEYSNCATNQVEKYNLTYDRLKERLK